MAPFRKKLVGPTSHLHRDKNMGYGFNNLIPAGESLLVASYDHASLSSGPNYCATLARHLKRSIKFKI